MGKTKNLFLELREKDMFRNEDEFLENTPMGFDGKFNWDFLLPIFGDSRIAPMDLDGVVERNDNILIMETKTHGKAIPTGQARTLFAFHKRGGMTILAVWMRKNKEAEEIEMVGVMRPETARETARQMEMSYFENGEEGKQFVYDFVASWWKNACENKFNILYND